MSDLAQKGNERFLCFMLANEEYAMPLLSVKEVIAVPEITPVPQTPPYFLGILNLRGQVISLIDLRIKLGIKPSNTSENAVIICEVPGFSMGVVVDSIESVLAIQAGQKVEKPDLNHAKASKFITGVYQKEERLVLMLDIEKTLDLQDISLMKKKDAA